MTVKNPITVNGIILSEYIKKHESRISLIAEKLKADGHDNVTLYHKPKIRHKNLKERNGEVKIMGNNELNQANYLNYLSKELKSTNSLQNLCIIVLLCCPDVEYHTSKSIGSAIIKQAKKLNIPVNEKIEYPVRACIGHLKKSVFSDYMLIHPKNNKWMSTSYSVIKEAKESLTLEKAIELANIPKSKAKAKNIPYKIIEAASDPIVKNESNQAKNSILDIYKIFEAIGKLNKDKNIFFVVCGDFTINLHPSKE